MNRKLTIVSILIGVCLAVGVYTLNFARAKQNPAAYQSKQTVPYTQQVTSCSKDILVVKAEVVDSGTPNPTIEVQVKNLSNLGIVAISLEATNGSESYTTTLRGSFKIDEPQVVIKPHERGNLSMSSPFGYVPLQIGGVFYEDGTEDGCASSLKTLHEIKESEKQKKEPYRETIPHSPHPDSR